MSARRQPKRHVEVPGELGLFSEWQVPRRRSAPPPDPVEWAPRRARHDRR